MRRLAFVLLLVPATLAYAQGPSSRGDANADNNVNAIDVTFLAEHLLGTGPAPIRACLADVNADSSVSTADAFRLIDFVLAGGASPPPQPAEVCDGVDDDCDGIPDDGFDLSSDENNCGFCGNVCQDVNSINICTSFACNPTCNFGWVSCDNNLNNGCETLLNQNPACTAAATFMGSVSGDTSSAPQTRTGIGEAFFRARITENDSSIFPEDLSAVVTLSVPPGTNYDLIVTCDSCGGQFSRTSSNTAGAPETIRLAAGDTAGGDDTFDVFIEIRFISAERTACGQWTLTVQGDTGAATDELVCG